MPRKKVKKIEPNGEIVRIQDGFTNRFNIPNFQSNQQQFMGRCITNIGIYLSWLSHDDINDITLTISKFMGVPLPIQPDLFERVHSNRFHYEKSRIYKLLNGLQKASKGNQFFTWLIIIEIVINSYCENANAKKNFASNIAETLVLSGKNAILCDTPDGYRFYPANAELLDIRLVVDVLKWLCDYPEAKEKYDGALRLYLKGDRTRHVLDDCRLSFELFVKQYLSNKKSLENQMVELGTFLKEKNISAELRNMFHSLLNGYTSFNNQNVKHNDKINESEIEFIIYVTGAFMRLLITSKEFGGR